VTEFVGWCFFGDPAAADTLLIAEGIDCYPIMQDQNVTIPPSARPCAPAK
jgi:hypothetical protein